MSTGARLVRAGVTVLVLVALVVGFTVGLVALGTRVFQPDPALARQVCVAEVADPAAEGRAFRAELAPDQTAYAALVVGVANRRGLPARAATIGVATAIQESGLRNIDYGDRDSLGLFQQRPSQGWGTEEQVQDPLYSTAAFYDGLEQVDGYTEMAVTVAAQRVQRSGFPDAYADHEGEGRALASALYGLAPAALSCDLRPVGQGDGDADPGTGTGTGTEVTAAQQADVLLDDLQEWGPPGWQPGEVSAAPAGSRTSETSPTGGEGAVVVMDARGAAEPARAAWALAHSSVAMAAARDVDQVEVAGLVWDRTDRGSGWVEAPAGGDVAPPPEGTVRVRFAQRCCSDT